MTGSKEEETEGRNICGKAGALRERGRTGGREGEEEEKAEAVSCKEGRDRERKDSGGERTAGAHETAGRKSSKNDCIQAMRIALKQ